MNQIKQAFARAKKDIFNLQSQISLIRQEISEIKRTLQQPINQTQPTQNQTGRQLIQTDNPPQEAPKSQIFPFSIGNQGVPTDRQTDRQTDRHIQKFAQPSTMLSILKGEEVKEPIQDIIQKDRITELEKVSEILDSLDSIKKELRFKFKKLTSQEMSIFSAIYQLEDQGIKPDYQIIAQKLNLSESSVRDYVLKIIKKGIPLLKTKHNNKKITLSILPDLKKMANLSTIMRLREI